MTTAAAQTTSRNDLVKNADGDDFLIWFDHHFQEWRAEQWNGLDKNYLHLPAVLHDKALDQLLRDVRSHRSEA